ncbi:MAG: helix-turn-helix domain-containing protein [Sphingobacteriales bacterium]|nr:helix-turn-helix domain-containing protein [Sphingobacteriales bacterium]
METFLPDTGNTLFQLAADLVNQTGRNLFLTGKAGTGKTTFLKYIRGNCPKQLAVVAPTGVAAINAGGVTIHSFFQLPFSPFIPSGKGTGFLPGGTETSNPHSLVSRLRFTSEKKKVLQQLELLIIDEISMVRCDLLDSVDTVLRHIRKKPLERFGGVQVLFIGDMYQLPPVVKDPEWKLLSGHYNSPYFFDSLVIREEPPLYIEFDKIYRQREDQFIRLLNQVRNNELDAEGYQILESRYQPVFKRTKEDGYILLTTHNEQARNINLAQLRELDKAVFQYDAQVENDFPEQAYPAELHLVLKEGAQVMFIRNDSAERGKRFYNGKIGTIARLEEEKIFVRCPDEDIETEVTRDKWENIRYTLDKASQTMKEELLGSFTQFPLRLAWAITIHKSQGLTFEKAIIDAGEAFAPGQVYVALSRCTSLNGMILKSKVRGNSLFTDPRILQFTKQMASSLQLQAELAAARRNYQERMLVDSFNFREAVSTGHSIKSFLKVNAVSFNKEAADWADGLLFRLTALQDTAVKFHQWLNGQFLLPEPPEENRVLLERTRKAATHFITGTEAVISLLKNTPLITDSRIQAKEINEQFNDLFAGLSLTLCLLRGFSGRLDTESWHALRRKFILPPFSVNVYAGVGSTATESAHLELHRALKKQRDHFCARKDVPVYRVASGKTLDEMVRYLPQTLEEIRQISGMGDARTKQYGRAFLDIILAYCRERALSSLVHEKPPKRERKERVGGKERAAADNKKGSSHAETFRLYKEGKTAEEIAKARKLALSTIEGHLARFIASGEIDINELVSPDKRKLIEAALSEEQGKSITPVKQKLGNLASFGEIKWMIAARDYAAGTSAD